MYDWKNPRKGYCKEVVGYEAEEVEYGYPDIQSKTIQGAPILCDNLAVEGTDRCEQHTQDTTTRPIQDVTVLLSDAVALCETEAWAYSRKQSHRENYVLRYIIEHELYQKIGSLDAFMSARQAETLIKAFYDRAPDRLAAGQLLGIYPEG